MSNPDRTVDYAPPEATTPAAVAKPKSEKNLMVLHSMLSDSVAKVAETGIASPSMAIVKKGKVLDQLAEENDLLLSEADLGLEQLQKNNLADRIEGEDQDEEFETLVKGAMQRLFPFDPKKEEKRLTAGRTATGQARTIESDVSLTLSGSHAARERLANADLSVEGRVRGFHKLHGLTSVRRNPVNGEREFLLHRAYGDEEAAEVSPTHYMGGGHTSWTPRLAASQYFIDEDKTSNDSPSKYKHLSSAWIPERHIKAFVPMLYSNQTDDRSLVDDEKEVIVSPGKFELHKPMQKSEEEPEEQPSSPCVLTIITNGKEWTCCAGHIEDGEDPETAARREILEETGLEPEYLSQLEYPHSSMLTCFSAQCQGIPHGRNDPDNEAKFQWVDTRKGIPENIWSHLAGPKDDTNIIRQLFSKEMGLKKSNQVWLEAGFMDLSKSDHIPLATTQKAPKKLGVLHQPKEAKEKNLVVVHNLDPDNLHHAEELGGIPSPSIAVRHKDHDFNSFGGITLVAHPSMVDPKQGTPIFNADIYSPRHPRANYKLNESLLKKTVQELLPHAEKVKEENHLRYNLGDQIEKRGASEAIANRSLQAILKAAYLHEKGHSTTPATHEIPLGNALVKEKPLQDFLLQHGVNRDFETGDEYHQGLTKALLDSYDQATDKQHVYDPRDNDIDEKGLLMFHDADRLLKDAGNVGKTQVDKWATQEAVDNKLESLGLKSDFDKWALKKIRPIQTTPFIPTAGRGRAYNVQNIINTIHRNLRGGEGNFQGGTIRAKGAIKFRSLDHIKQHQGQLTDRDAFEQSTKELDHKLEGLADSVAKHFKYSDSSYVMDSLTEAIGDSYKRGNNLRYALTKSGFQNIPDSIIRDIAEYSRELVNAPTQYFEAKPKRLVGINEFKGAVLPIGTSDETAHLLQRHGLPVRFYSPGLPGDRLSVTNKLAQENDLMLSEEDLDFEPLLK
jgi:hypothetical protein